jgi:hypothetical protein
VQKYENWINDLNQIGPKWKKIGPPAPHWTKKPGFSRKITVKFALHRLDHIKEPAQDDSG